MSRDGTAEFTAEERSFISITLIFLLLLLAFLPFSLVVGLTEMCMIMTGLIIFQAVVYYLARVRKRFVITSNWYAWISYLILIATYLYNSGIDGPVLFLFFLSFLLLIAFTKRKHHSLWVIMHSLVVIGLLSVDYFNPGLIPDTYTSRAGRYIDIISTYFITLGVLYWITIYLRNNFQKEKKLSENRADELESQRNKVEALNEQKNKLFSIIAHDLRSPLNSIQGYLEMLGEVDLDKENRDVLQKELLQQTRNTSEMLTNLLHWSKTQMDGSSIRLQSLPVYETLQRTIETQKLIAAKKGIHVYSNINPVLRLEGDADMLQLIIRNILNNAIKFSSHGSIINLDAKTVDGFCRFIIADNGTGIPMDKQTQLFSFKAMSTFGTGSEKGIGLGLVLCKEFVDLQKGRISFESVLGKGTTFYIDLPLA